FVVTLGRTRFLTAATALHILLRLGAFMFLYGLVGLAPPSDVPAFYRPWADAVASGKLPYLDIATPFAPLFPYLLAGIGSLGSNLWFVATFLAFDLAAFMLWLALAEFNAGRRASLAMVVLYTFNPDLTGMALSGQDESLSLLLSSMVFAAALA